MARTAVARSRPLAELAGQLQSCAAFVGHDSGITHLAAALGLPTLVLWADAVEGIWRPQGERLALIREVAGICSISVERVAKELSLMLADRPR